MSHFKSRHSTELAKRHAAQLAKKNQPRKLFDVSSFRITAAQEQDAMTRYKNGCATEAHNATRKGRSNVLVQPMVPLDTTTCAPLCDECTKAWDSELNAMLYGVLQRSQAIANFEAGEKKFTGAAQPAMLNIPRDAILARFEEFKKRLNPRETSGEPMNEDSMHPAALTVHRPFIIPRGAQAPLENFRKWLNEKTDAEVQETFSIPSISVVDLMGFMCSNSPDCYSINVDMCMETGWGSEKGATITLTKKPASHVDALPEDVSTAIESFFRQVPLVKSTNSDIVIEVPSKIPFERLDSLMQGHASAAGIEVLVFPPQKAGEPFTVLASSGKKNAPVAPEGIMRT